METIQKIAVIGAGTMGPGIAQALATGGYAVSIWDPIAEARERGKARLSDGWRPLSETGRWIRGRRKRSNRE